MADSNRYKMSAQRLEELKKELYNMQTVRAKEVAEQIKEARSFGDLSENSEYDEAKTEQGKLYSKMAEIQDLIEHAEITEESEDLGKVGLGSIVTVKDLEFDSIEKYKIVGSQEANPLEGKISDDSPIGKALYGHESGETVIVEAPGGNYSYEIISIEK
ncbi:MAG: transcription elongation factor GreA [Oscillospiraceae bacterium]|nr:transcription elongation factor GreA [Oscillospiraceae bacterium]